MKIMQRKDLVFDTLLDVEYARNLYYIHVHFYDREVQSIMICRNLENVLIFDRKNYGWQIKPADKQTDRVFKETLKLLNLTMPKPAA